MASLVLEFIEFRSLFISARLEIDRVVVFSQALLLGVSAGVQTI